MVQANVFSRKSALPPIDEQCRIMGMYEPQDLKKELSKLNVSCDVFAGDDYLYISMRGYENNLPEACQLLARQILMPKLDENN